VSSRPQENGKQRCLSSVAALSRAFALSVPNEKAMAVRDEVSEGKPESELDLAVFADFSSFLGRGLDAAGPIVRLADDVELGGHVRISDLP
jgi:hypothetical protein